MPDHRGRIVVVSMVLAVVPAVAACSSSHPAAHPSGTAGSGSGASSTTVATRWWSNSATKVGSVISASQPLAVATRLHASRTDYCGMLRQTVAAGKSILPGATATDPALLTSTKAFVGELQHSAPSPVAGPWKTLGSAVVTLVASGGKASGVKGIDAAAVQRASAAVATDAKRNCGVDLSAAPAR